MGGCGADAGGSARPSRCCPHVTPQHLLLLHPTTTQVLGIFLLFPVLFSIFPSVCSSR